MLNNEYILNSWHIQGMEIDVGEGLKYYSVLDCEELTNKEFSVLSYYREPKGRKFKPENEKNS